MKIELKFTADELQYLNQKTTATLSIDPNQLLKEKRSAYTIMLDVADKLATKTKTVMRSATIFDIKKKHKITLKWHEAETLEQYIDTFSSYQDNEFSKHIARKVIAQINQKLA